MPKIEESNHHGRTWSSWRRFAPHPADALIAVLLVWASWSNIVGQPDAYRSILLGVLSLVCAAAIAWRRALPLVSVLVIGVAMLIHLAVFDLIHLVAVVPTFVAVWTAQSRIERPWRTAFTTLALLGSEVAVLRGTLSLLEPASMSDYAILVISTALGLAVAALGGARSRSARDRKELAIERLAMLEAQRDAQADLAVANERARIAQDLHDLLGHTLAAVAVQAEGARFLLDSAPERADEALETIARISREGVTRVHDLVASLHADAAGSAGARESAASPADAPEVGASPAKTPSAPWPEVVALAEELRVPLSLEITGASPLSGGARDALVRNCREALTNASRHGAPDSIHLFASADERGAELVVENRPNGASRDPEHRGLGLESMRRRAEAAGLDFSAGIDEDGTWRARTGTRA